MSGDIITTHISADDIIANIHSMTGGDTSYDSAIRSLTSGSSYNIHPTLNVYYITYVMADTLTYELSSVVEPVPSFQGNTYIYIDTEETSYSASLLSAPSETPVDLSSVYYGFIAS